MAKLLSKLTLLLFPCAILFLATKLLSRSVQTMNSNGYMQSVQSANRNVEAVGDDTSSINEDLFHVDLETAFGMNIKEVEGTTSIQNHTDKDNWGPPKNMHNPPPEEMWLRDNINPPRGRIPRTINKIYFQKDGRFPRHVNAKASATGSIILEAHGSWSKLNPGYAVRYYDLHSARRYLHLHYHEVFLRTFDCIQAFAAKSDFFRMALLYREGGFHSDWKQVCLERGLLDRIANETDFFVALDIGNGFTQASRSCAANSFIGSTPHHTIAAKYLDLVMRNVQQSMYPFNALLLTGPCLLGMAVLQFRPEFGDDESISNHSTPTHNTFHHDADGHRQQPESYFSWKGQNIILGKCKGCGSGQDWGDVGNNYNTLFEKKTFYCEDSASIF